MRRLITLLILLLCLSAEAAQKRVLRLRAESTVSTPQVTLKDIVLDVSRLSPAEQEFVIMDSPEVNKQVTLVWVAYRLQNLASLMDISLAGPGRLTIIRQADNAFVEEVRVLALAKMATVAPWKDSQCDLDFDAAECRRIALLSGNGKASIVEAVEGATPDTVRLRLSCEKTAPVLISGRLSRQVTVLTFRNALAKGSVINTSDILATMVRSDASLRNLPSRPEEVIGMELTQPVAVGARARFTDLMQPFCCKKGDVVQAQADAGGLVLSVMTSALAPGRKGDLIKAQNLQSKKAVDVELTGPGQGRVR